MKKYVFLLILLLGLFLRLHDLDKESLWLDEVYSLRSAQAETFPQLVSGIEEMEGSPFGHHLLLRYWIKLFGNSAFSVRFPSVIFGVLAILVMYKISLILTNRKIALLSSLLLSTSMLQVLFSQEARLYSLYGFLTLLATYFFINIIKKDKYYLPYAIFLLLAFYVNYLTGALLIIYTLIARKKEKLLFTNLIIFLLTIPLMPLLLDQFVTGNTGLTTSLISKGLPSFLASFGIFFYALPVVFIVITTIFIISIKDKITSLISKQFDFALVTFILIFAASYLYLVTHTFTFLGIPLTRNPITHSYFLIRHSFFFVPVFYFILSYKIINLKSKKLKMFCILIVLFVNLFSLAVYYETPNKPQWQEAASYIQDDSLILLDSAGYSNVFLFNYYHNNSSDIIRLTWSDKRRSFSQIADDELLLQLHGKKEFWLILSRNKRTNDHYKNLLDQYYNLDLEKEFYQISVFHYNNNFI